MLNKYTPRRPPATPRALVEGAIAGNEAALARLVEFQRPRIVSLAAFVTRRPGDAEDLAHDILLRLVQAVPRLTAPETFDVWVYRLSRNCCVDHFRRRRFEAPFPDAGREPRRMLWASSPRQPDDEIEAGEARRRLRAALRHLPPAWRRAVVLRDLEELSYEEAAARLRVPIGTMKSRVSRGRERLAYVLGAAPVSRPAGRPPAATARPAAQGAAPLPA